MVRGLEFIMYTEQVKRRVKDSWIVAEKKPGLTATVRFGVQPDGEVFAIEIVKRSGDRTFDDSVVRAVNKANPLPPPPQAYQQEFATQKVEVIFGGEEHTN
jgi:colicin import membrane protein